MRKEELRKLRALPATKEMMEKGKRHTEEPYGYGGKKRTWVVPEYKFLMRAQNLSGYVKIAIFFPEKMMQDIKTPRYEIFLNVKGGEYITRELDDEGKEVRWLTAMVHNMDDMQGYFWSFNERKAYLTQDTKRTLNRLPITTRRKEIDGVWRLCRWQQEQKDAETKRKEEKEKAPWDADMKLIPDLPKDFKEWMRRNGPSKYYIFYEYSPQGQKTGYCSKCRRYVPIADPKHGKKTTCPHCRTKAEFKAHTKIASTSTGEYYADLIQKFPGGIVIRRFVQRQRYRKGKYTNPIIATKELTRTMIYETGEIKRYEWGSYKNKELRWIRNKNYFPARESLYSQMSTKLYKRNFSRLKRTPLFAQSAIDLWPELPTSVPNYLEVEKGNPAVEMLAKIGMFRLAEGFMTVRYEKGLLNQDATEIAKILKIDKNRLTRLKSMDGNIASLKWMQCEKLANTIWPDEMIKDLGEANIEPNGFGFLPVPISHVKVYNYLKKQAEMMDESLWQTLQTWRDYINMAERNKMNVRCEQIMKPRSLKKAHTQVILLNQSKGLEKQAKEIQKKWPKVEKQLPKLHKFEFSDGTYTILAPKSVLDIVKEGTILSHCVHNCDYYFDRIQRDESYLFFLRKSQDTDVPWYTLEVEPSGNIRQKRTTGDNQNKDFNQAIPFLKKWQQFFQKQLTEKEKQLGKVADSLRIENYKQLRKNQNRIWHGKLAGQLLADVLEQDFMAVGG